MDNNQQKTLKSFIINMLYLNRNNCNYLKFSKLENKQSAHLVCGTNKKKKKNTTFQIFSVNLGLVGHKHQILNPCFPIG